MAGEPPDLSSAALDDVAYLGRSANRIRILSALASSPGTRSALENRTGVTSTTVGRILNELQEREWVERTVDGEYTATATGQVVVREFMPIVEALETVRSLGDAVGWLPTDELSVDICHFADATVRRPTANAPFLLVEHIANLVRNGSVFRTLTFLDPPSPVARAMQTGVTSGELRAEHVLAGGLTTYLRDNQRSPPDWQAYLEAGASVYRFEGRIPCNLFLVDETVLIMSDRPEGGGGAVESTDERVLSAAEELLAAYRERAEPVAAPFFE